MRWTLVSLVCAVALAPTALPTAVVTIAAASLATPVIASAADAQRCRPLRQTDRVRMDWRDLSVLDASRMVSCWTGRNLIVTASAQAAKLQVIAPRPVPSAEVWRLYRSALRGRGLHLTRRSKHWLVSATANSQATRIQTQAVRAATLAKLLGRFAGISAWPGVTEHDLWISGGRRALRTARRWLALLDVPGQRLYLVTLQRRSAEDMVEVLRETFGARLEGAALVPVRRGRRVLFRGSPALWRQLYQAIRRLDR